MDSPGIDFVIHTYQREFCSTIYNCCSSMTDNIPHIPCGGVSPIHKGCLVASKMYIQSKRNYRDYTCIVTVPHVSDLSSLLPCPSQS